MFRNKPDWFIGKLKVEHLEFPHEIVVLILDVLDTQMIVSISKKFLHCHREIKRLYETIPLDRISKTIRCDSYSQLSSFHHLCQILMITPSLNNVLTIQTALYYAWCVFGYKALVKPQWVIADFVEINLFNCRGQPQRWQFFQLIYSLMLEWDYNRWLLNYTFGSDHLLIELILFRLLFFWIEAFRSAVTIHYLWLTQTKIITINISIPVSN
jgi:hypothetical protein